MWFCCLQQKRLVAQCAERLAEYRHLVHGAAGGARDEMAFKVGQSLDALESGQVRCLLLCSRQHTFACKSEWGLRVAQRDLVELLGY